MAELVDALASEANARKGVWVRFPLMTRMNPQRKPTTYVVTRVELSLDTGTFFHNITYAGPEDEKSLQLYRDGQEWIRTGAEIVAGHSIDRSVFDQHGEFLGADTYDAHDACRT